MKKNYKNYLKKFWPFILLIPLFYFYSDISSNSEMQIRSVNKPENKSENINVQIVVTEAHDTYIKFNLNKECKENQFSKVNVASGDLASLDGLNATIPIRDNFFIEFDEFKYIPEQKLYAVRDLIFPITSENHKFPFGNYRQNISLILSKDGKNFIPYELEVINTTRWFLLNGLESDATKFFKGEVSTESLYNKDLNVLLFSFFKISYRHPQVYMFIIIGPVLILIFILLIMHIRVTKKQSNNLEALGIVLTIVFGILSIRSFYADLTNEPNLMDVILVALLLWSLGIMIHTYFNNTEDSILKFKK